VLTSVRSHLGAIGRWIAPSVIAACTAGLVAGALGHTARGWFGIAATIGFVSVLAVPLIFAMSVIVRGLVHAWQPRALVASLVEEGGGAPGLAGWVAVIWLGVLALVWAMFQGTWLLNAWTAFKPLTIGFAQPILAVLTVIGIVVASRPIATGLAWLARTIDAPWRQAWHWTLFGPRTILIGAAVITLVVGYLIWHFVVDRRLNSPDPGFLLPPAAGITAAVLAHFGFAQLRGIPRWIAGGVIGAASAATIVIAFVAASSRPALTLEIWGDTPLAAIAIDTAFDLESIRADLPIAPFRPLEHTGAAHPDIVLVTIEGARADHTPPYGGMAEMPALRELGQRGAVFAWAFAPSSIAKRSLPSMMTGLSPNRIHGRVTSWAVKLDPRHVVLTERMRAAGYETAGFLCCEELFVGTGLTRGFEHVAIEHDPAKLASAARAWLDERERRPGNRPLFVWIHVAPTDTTALARTDDERRRRYDQALAVVDTALVEVLAAFAHRTPSSAPITIVSSDHGQSLGEHGHAPDLYSSQIHAPLVIAGPRIKAQRIPETVSLTDLTPTIIELAGFIAPRGIAVDGHSLVDLATGERAGESNGGTAFAWIPEEKGDKGKPGIGMVVRGGWKLIDLGLSTELYDLKADSAERYNLFGQRPQIVSELRGLLSTRLRGAAQSPF
jgi:arylsulfatase A-like enzyme